MVEYLLHMNSLAKEKKRQQQQDSLEEEERQVAKKRSKRPSGDHLELSE